MPFSPRAWCSPCVYRRGPPTDSTRTAGREADSGPGKLVGGRLRSRAGGDISRAAELAQIGRQALYRAIRKHNIERSDFR